MAYPTKGDVGLTVAKNTLTDQLTNVTYSTTQTVTGVRFRGCQITVAAAVTVTFVDCWFYLHTWSANSTSKVIFQNCEFGYDGTATAQDPIGGTWDPEDYNLDATVPNASQEWHDTVIHYVREGPRPLGSQTWIMDRCWIGDMYGSVGGHNDGLQAIGQASSTLTFELTNTYIFCGPADDVVDVNPSGWTQAVNISETLGDVVATISGCALGCAGVFVLGVESTAEVDMQNNTILRTSSQGDVFFPTSSVDVNIENRYSDGVLIPGSAASSGDSGGGAGEVAFVVASGVDITASGAGSDAVVTLHGDALADDVLYVFQHIRGTAADSAAAPSGFVDAWGSGWRISTAGSTCHVAVARRVITSGDVASPPTWEFMADDEGDNRGLSWAIVRGADTTTPEDAVAVTFDVLGFGSNYGAPTVTTSEDDELVLAFVAAPTDGSPFTPPSGYTELTDSELGSTISQSLADGTKATAGATGTLTFVASASGLAIGATVAIKNAAVSTSSGSGTPVVSHGQLLVTG